MAKRPRVNPGAEFLKSSSEILRMLLLSSYTPIARLAGIPAFEAAQDRIADLLNVNASAYDRNDFKTVLVNIGTNIKKVKESNAYNTKFKRDARSGYAFSFSKKPTQGGVLEFNSLINQFPGSEVKGFSSNLSAEDKCSIVWAMMAAAGFQFTPSATGFIAYFSPTVILNDAKSKQKRANLDDVEMATGDVSGIAGMLDTLNIYANNVHTQPVANAVFTAALRYNVTVDSFGNDVTINIEPITDVNISNDLVPFMAETNDKSAVDYLVFTWMQDCLTRATKGGRRGNTANNMPAVDLRITSDKLKKVAAKFQVAKPRLNANKFCVNNHGLPMFVPEVDQSADFMRANSNFEVDEEGFLKYDDIAYEWSSKIIMVDWFNDVIVYTYTDGRLAIYRLLGYVPFDATSEYVFLNAAWSDRSLKSLWKTLPQLIDSLVSASDAEAELTPEQRSPTAFNAGKVTRSFGSLFGDIASRPLSRNLQPLDNEYRYEKLHNCLVKHIFGLDLEELPPFEAGMCSQAAAYLRAANKKRKNITMAIMDRLEGIEYFLRMSAVFARSDAFETVRTEAKTERDRNRNQPLLTDLDIPNLDAGNGKNLQAWQPHQVRNFSNAKSGASSALVTIDTGGGKTLYQLVDILMQLQQNPKWRPLIITKPRLVKNMVSEINWATKGKVNVVSLRMSQMRYLGTQLGLTTAESVINWVKSFPINTIFVCGYTDFSRNTKLFDDLEIPDRVLLEDVALPQFLHILRIIGFELLRLDESHAIKNLQSRRTRFAFSVLAQAKSKAMLSGTTVNNTALDLLGQSYGLNPMIFGNDPEKFMDDYNLPRGLIKTDEASQRVNMRMKKFMQTTTASEEDWSFLLPDLEDKTLAPLMTPKQEQFYAILMQRAEAELSADDKDGDPDSEDGDADDEEDSDEQFLMKADRALVTVEQFLVSPDTNLEYLAWKGNPVGDDLVSPCVRAIDEQLAKIYANRGINHTNNKTAVFGINKVASLHFMRHTKFKEVCMHYTAGDEETIRQWKANPDKYVLVADSTSLREGENMQMLSHIFDMQATWTPGDFKQLLARMYRPDPKGIYAKDDVTHWWVVPQHKQIQPSLATVKLARMISKAISLARFKYDGDSRWYEVSHMFDGLDLLTMNLETVFRSTHNDLAPYFNAWSKYIAWQRNLNQKARIKIAGEIEQENPGLRLVDDKGRVLDRQLFTKSIMIEAKSTKDLAGSKRVFTPWERGATPADRHDMFLKILGKDEIERGAYVMTEYGPGIVQNVGDNQLVVELHGRKKAKLYRDRVAVANGEGVGKLTALIRNPSAWQAETYVDVIKRFTPIDVDASLAPRAGRLSPKLVPTTPIPPASGRPKPVVTVGPAIDVDAFKKKKIIDDPEEEDPADEEEDETTEIPGENIQVVIINGMPALSIVDAPSGVENIGWTPVEAFVGMRFKSWDAAENFIVSMTKKFAITKSKLATLNEEMDEFRMGKSMRLTKRVTDSQARNFFLANHRTLATAVDGRERIDPYWTAIGSNIYLAFSKASHKPSVFRWLTLMASKNSTKLYPPKTIDARHINIFNTLPEAIADLKVLAQHFDLPETEIRREIRDIKDTIDELKARRTSPARR